MWFRFSQCPISCVAVRPRLNGAAAVPVVPNAVLRIATPSVAGGPPGNCAYPRRPPPSVQTHRFRYLLDGHPSAPPVDVVFTSSFVVKLALVVFVRVMPFVGFPFGSLVASAKRMSES